MKRKSLTAIEHENLNTFHKRGCQNRTKCKVNQVCLDMSNSKIHSLKMLDICRELLDKDHKFICEAVPNKIPGRRYDIVDITELTIIECEVTGKLKLDADITYMYTKEGWKKYYGGF